MIKKRPMRLTHFFLIFSICLLILFPLPVLAERQGPSFPCHKRLTVNEKLICSSSQLSRLDVEMVELFESLSAIADRSTLDLIESDQQLWLEERQSCGQNYKCTLDLILFRIEALDKDLMNLMFEKTPQRKSNKKHVKKPAKPEKQAQQPMGIVAQICVDKGLLYHKGDCVKKCPHTFVKNKKGTCEPDGFKRPPCDPGEREWLGFCVSK